MFWIFFGFRHLPACLLAMGIAAAAFVAHYVMNSLDPQSILSFRAFGGVVSLRHWVHGSLGILILTATGWLLNGSFQPQRPGGTRNSLYLLCYVLLALTLTRISELPGASLLGFLFALSISALQQATFQKRPEPLLAVAGSLMAFLVVLHPVAYPWLPILLFMVVLVAEFPVRMVFVYGVGVLIVPYLWFSSLFLAGRPGPFQCWEGFVAWTTQSACEISPPDVWLLVVATLPVFWGVLTTLINRPSRTRISRSTQRQMGILLVSGFCLLILAATRRIPCRWEQQVGFMLPALTYFAARGLERVSPGLYPELVLWVWVALVCGAAEGLNLWVFSSFLPL